MMKPQGQEAAPELLPCPCGAPAVRYFTLLFPLVKRDGTVEVMAADDLVDDLCQGCFERLAEEEKVGWRRIDA